MSEADESIGSTLHGIGRWSATHRKTIFAIVAVLVAISAVGITGLQMNMGMELYINEDSDTMAAWNEIQSDFDKGNVAFVVIETPDDFDLYEPENAQEIADLYERYYDEVDSAGLVTSFAHPIQAGPGGGEIPDTKEEVLYSLEATQSEHRSNERVIYNLHPDAQETGSFDGGDTAVIMVQYGDATIPDDRTGEFFGFLPPSEDEIVEEQIRDATAAADLPDEMDVTVTGTPVFEEAAFGLMLPEMIQLFTIAMGVILVSIVIIMRGRLRKTHRVALPLVSTLVALSMMLGMMGYVGFNFNAIMLGVLPIALGLGIDYGLQIQSRYVEERANGQAPISAGEIAAGTTGRALALALGTTVVGLGSLLAAEVPPVRQFGVTAAFSVLASMGLSLTFLIAMLVTFDDQAPGSTPVDQTSTTASTAEQPSGLEGVFDRVGGGLSARPLLVVLLFGAVIAGGAAAYPAVDTKTDMLDYWPDIQEREDIHELEETVASPNIAYAIVDANEYAYDREHFEQIQEFQLALEEHEHIVTPMSPVRAMEITNEDELPETQEAFEQNLEKRAKVDRPPTLGKTPDDHPNRVIVQVFIEDIEGQAEREVIDHINSAAEATMPDMETRVTGEMVINRNVIENVTAGLTRTTLVSFGLGLLFLGLVLRSGRESVLLIGTVAASTMALVAGGMYLLGVPWNPLTVTTASIVFGVGITYGIHVYERFREEVARGGDPEAAIRTAVVRKSRPVLGSGLTTMLGFGVLIMSQFPVLSNFGIAIGLAMGLALVSAFLFMPAVVVLLARRGIVPAGNTAD